MNLQPEDPTKRLQTSDKFFKILAFIALTTALVTLAIVLYLIFDTQSRYQSSIADTTKARNKQLEQIESGNKRIEGLVYCIISNPVAKEDDPDTRIAKIKACADNAP